MPSCKINAYHVTQGTHDFFINLPTHVTITGRENHFDLARRDAENVVTGMQIAMPLHRITIRSIDMEMSGGMNTRDGKDIFEIRAEDEREDA